MASTTFNQYFNKLTYKPYLDSQYSQQTFMSESTAPIPIQQQQQHQQYQLQQHPDFVSVNSYPMMPDNSCSVWQNTYPTDYLGLPTFDHHQESCSPAASALSSSLSPSSMSSSSSDALVYSADDFCVSDLLESQSHQHYMLSPTCTNTTVTSTTLNDHYYAQQPMHQQQHLSPKSECWISPATPLMESMDGYVSTQNNMMEQPYFFVKQEETDSIFMPTPSLTVTMDMGSSISNNITRESSNKRPAKKIHHCPHCHHTSNRANNMKEHILTHDPYRPKLFACTTCQKSFARKHDMKRHTKSHQRVHRRQSKLVVSSQQPQRKGKQRRQQDQDQ